MVSQEKTSQRQVRYQADKRQPEKNAQPLPLAAFRFPPSVFRLAAIGPAGQIGYNRRDNVEPLSHQPQPGKRVDHEACLSRLC